MVNHPSSSLEQQLVGDALIKALAESLNITLIKKIIELGDGVRVEVDGYSDEPPILCEAWAHIGKLKGGQSDKVMSDAAKLLFAERRLGKQYRKILLFADTTPYDYFSGNNWQAHFLLDSGIELCVFELPAILNNSLLKAQIRQVR